MKLYLISYNVASLAGWAYVLFLAIQQLIKAEDYKNVFEATWPVLIVVQSTALFEVCVRMTREKETKINIFDLHRFCMLCWVICNLKCLFFSVINFFF